MACPSAARTAAPWGAGLDRPRPPPWLPGRAAGLCSDVNSGLCSGGEGVYFHFHSEIDGASTSSEEGIVGPNVNTLAGKQQRYSTFCFAREMTHLVDFAGCELLFRVGVDGC